MAEHFFAVSLEWSGNTGSGTSGYKDYRRDTLILAEGKKTIDGSADKAFHGDRARWNPEELLIAALSECHLLSFLHVASSAGVVVESYTDSATGTLVLNSDGGGHMVEVTLRPRIEISAGDQSVVPDLHRKASELCFIANSVNFPVHHEPVTLITP
jgi:organic hydroperoxide reductase OsmC/OhrA